MCTQRNLKNNDVASIIPTKNIIDTVEKEEKSSKNLDKEANTSPLSEKIKLTQ